MSQDKELNAVEEMELEVKAYEIVKTRGLITKTFMESDMYEKVLEPVFIKGYRDTASKNCALFNTQQTTNFVHGMKARAIFEDFIERQIQEGIVAEIAIQELEEEIKIAQKEV